ncbi:MAG: CPBP family glutamic-type intramembrane protease [Planctomycetota bacterium]|jgi:membrane protease YdiL (CAAX protease family)
MSQAEAHGSDPKRGVLARPLDALVFLLPLIVFYEVICFLYPARVIAFELLQRFLELFGNVGAMAPGLAVVVILIATHVASGETWSIHWRHVGWMYGEAVLLTIPLLAVSFVTLSAGDGGPLPLVAELGFGIGAGVYEELVFRLVLLSIMVIIGCDILRLDRKTVAFAAIILSSLIFAAHHHHPIGIEPFNLAHFMFRTIAGIYLATIFWYRGYGLAAGCHAFYNTAVVLVSWLE